MAHKKKESTGISLLSMYNDEDEEMEDVENEEEAEQEEQGHQRRRDDDDEDDEEEEPNSMEDDSKNIGNNEVSDNNNVNTPQIQIDNSTPQQQSQETNHTSPMELNISRKEKLTIVDYGHDEVAMSPEAEEGEIVSTGQVSINVELRTSNGDLQEMALATTQVSSLSTQATSPQSYDQLNVSQVDTTDHGVSESQAAAVEDDMQIAKELKDIDPLDKFLPPPPMEMCSQELQERINKFLALKRNGKSYNSEVRNKKAYRNPDFLAHAVKYQDIDQLGSCFSKDVFDPYGYDKSDYYEEIEADLKRELERKEQEKKRSQKVDFVAGGTQPGIVTPAPKVGVPIQVPTVSTSGLNLVSTTTDVARDGRQNKKSKWDKVDSDRRTSLPTGGQDSLPNVGAHPALLSAANAAGAGYTAFAQQRRREAEEKRSGERRRS